jgi:hypothetical protein
MYRLLYPEDNTAPDEEIKKIIAAISDPYHMESLLLLACIRCPKHGDWLMKQGRDGRLSFYCGCEIPAGRELMEA